MKAEKTDLDFFFHHREHFLKFCYNQWQVEKKNLKFYFVGSCEDQWVCCFFQIFVEMIETTQSESCTMGSLFRPRTQLTLGSCRRGYQSKKSVLKSLTHNWEQEWAEQVGAACPGSHQGVRDTLPLRAVAPQSFILLCFSVITPTLTIFRDPSAQSCPWLGESWAQVQGGADIPPSFVCLLYLFDELAPGGDCGFRLPNSWCHLKDFWPSSAFLGETFFPQDNSFSTGTTFLCFSPSLKNPHRCPVRPFVQLIYEHLWGLIEKNQKTINTKYLAISWENPIFIITYAWGYTKKSWVVLKSVMQSTIHSSKSVSWQHL